MLEVFSNIASILTALIAVAWFLYSRKINYFERGEITGCYKIFDSLKGAPDNRLALFEFRINHMSNKGWFVGRIDYAEIFNPPKARSEGGWNCIGFIKYSLINDLFSILKKSNVNPLILDQSRGYKGVLYIISRNDFDITKRDWKEFLVESYTIFHYRNSFRLSLSKKEVYNNTVTTHFPDELFFVNTDIVKDHLYDHTTKTEFTHYPNEEL